VLVSAGNVKRARLEAARAAVTAAGAPLDEAAIAALIDEQDVLIQRIF
jgi:hypothetical protein